ncbi:MAG: PIN domain nuclease of toxin-antitoxin system [Hyphomicrobiaceae bacterium]
MNYLIDTHCWLWLQTTPERIPAKLLRKLELPENKLFLSAASSWEIAIKVALGKLTLPDRPANYVPSRMQASGCQGLAISHRHALAVAELPAHHGDPFDRLLIAQANLEKMTLITADAALAAYDVRMQFVER